MKLISNGDCLLRCSAYFDSYLSFVKDCDKNDWLNSESCCCRSLFRKVGGRCNKHFSSKVPAIVVEETVEVVANVLNFAYRLQSQLVTAESVI